jgi:hypothetical protein
MECIKFIIILIMSKKFEFIRLITFRYYLKYLILKIFKSLQSSKCLKPKHNLRLQNKLPTIKIKRAEMFVQLIFKLPRVLLTLIQLLLIVLELV